MTLSCLAETLSEDEDEPPRSGPAGDGISVNALAKHITSAGADFNPTPGGPFSALTPSMWPQDILHKLSNPVGVFYKYVLVASCSLSGLRQFCLSTQSSV